MLERPTAASQKHQKIVVYVAFNSALGRLKNA